MANVDRVNGFKPVKHLNGSPYNGAYTEYAVAAGDGTALFVGDAVKLAGSADADGVATVIAAAATNPVVGVVVGFTPQYRAASTARKVYVADARDLVFEVQADAAIAVTSVGLNTDLVATSGGSTVTGASGMELDASEVATTATLVFKILGFPRRADNEINATDNKVLVMINAHQHGDHTGTAGV
jgi:hypothetical protein